MSESQENGIEQFQYTARSIIGTYDTRHEAVGDLARYGDWENDTVVPITENCLVRQVSSITVGPVHLGDKHWNDREIYPTTRGVTQIKQVSLVKEVNGNRDSVEESWWATDCPVCHSRLEVQGASEDNRRELLEELLDCCDVEWFPPSDWIEDCDVCGEDHREASGCTSLTYREPFPSPEEHRYDCSECEWSGEGDDFDNSLGNCPDCGTSAVQALPLATDGGQSRDDLRWGDPELVPTHYGEHDPVSIGEDVRCAMCGARAENGDPEAWPSADEDRWEDFDAVAPDGGRDDHELDHYDLILRAMEEGLLISVNNAPAASACPLDEVTVVYSKDQETEVMARRGHEDRVWITRDRSGDLVWREEDVHGSRYVDDVVSIEIVGMESAPDPDDLEPRPIHPSIPQRKRFEAIKAEWSEDGTPELTDRQVLDGLLDTKQAAEDGYYSDQDSHEFELGDRFAGLPEYRWEVTNRMVDVDTDDTLYHLLGVGDPNRNDTKVITESSLRENFEQVAETGDGDE